MTLEDLFSILKGGAGSGHHDHVGIPGHKGGSMPGLKGSFTLNTENRTHLERSNGKLTEFHGKGSVEFWSSIISELPPKAQDAIEDSKRDIKLYHNSERKGGGEYSGSLPGIHRVTAHSRIAALEEIGHLLDMELSKGKGELSRTKAYQDLIKTEKTNFAAMYTTGKATEDFAKSFVAYITRPNWFKQKYPKHYEFHKALWE